MEHGFYHPSRGYWQTTNLPDQNILDTYPEGTAEVPLKPGSGYEWSGATWVAPISTAVAELEAERATMIVSRFQAKAALLQAGMLDAVTATVAAADPVVQLAWAEAVEFRRNSPTINALKDLVPLTDEQIDDLFRAATQIEA